MASSQDIKHIIFNSRVEMGFLSKRDPGKFKSKKYSIWDFFIDKMDTRNRSLNGSWGTSIKADELTFISAHWARLQNVDNCFDMCKFYKRIKVSLYI